MSYEDSIKIDTVAQRATIDCFPGISLSDAWIHCVEEVEFDTRTPTVLIAGSALEFEGSGRNLPSRAVLSELCESLACIIGEQGLNLVNGACPGLPDDVMRSFLDQTSRGVGIGLSAYPSPIEHSSPKEFAPEGFPISGDLTVFCGTGFELLNVLNTLCADILIVVGGGVGTLLEAATAVEQQLPVICLDTSGGVANELLQILSKYVAEFKTFDVQLVSNLEELNSTLVEKVQAFSSNGGLSRASGLVSAIGASANKFQIPTKITISDEDDSISYDFDGNSITLHDPVLMTDRVKIARMPVRGEVILQSLDENSRYYSYDKLELITSKNQAAIVWGPNIDSILLIRELKRADVSRVRMLDVGSGSGFISLWAACNLEKCVVTGVDVNEVAILSAQWNAQRLGIDAHCRFEALAFQELRDQKFDLITCNPPYIPTSANLYPSVLASSYGGTKLLINFLDNYQQFLNQDGYAFVVVSSASLGDSNVAKRLTDLIDNGKAEACSEKLVPLKVSPIIGNSEWVSELVSHGGIYQREDDDYMYWHKIQVWKLN